MTLPIINFTESLFQHLLINIKDVMNQTILIKIVQSFKLINQLKLRKLSSDLTISSFIKISRPDILAVIMIIIF